MMHSIPSVDTTFAEDVREGLSSDPKWLPSKYFYDEVGDGIFQEIMGLDEYYPTACEYEILQQQADHILELFSAEDRAFDLIELGAGDGYKTEALLDRFVRSGTAFRYLPNDISPAVLETLEKGLLSSYPDLEVVPFAGDYFDLMERMAEVADRRKVVLFLGGNIGNYDSRQGEEFLERLRQHLAPGDKLMIGFDLKKDPRTILRAYDDPQGVTARFNLNLLERIDRELGGHFDTSKFMHYPVYDPLEGEARSYLLSTEEQEVPIDALNTRFRFRAWEPIFTERSRKFDLKGIEALAEKMGFSVEKHLTDTKGYFVDSVWKYDPS